MSSPTPSEVSFYSDDQGVRVTNTRLIVDSTTYAMGNITSVSRATHPPSRLGPIIVGAVSVLFFAQAFIGGTSVAHKDALPLLGIGTVVLGGAVLWWIMQKTVYALRVASSSGEATPISSTDRARIDKIVQAVNEAIISRG